MTPNKNVWCGFYIVPIYGDYFGTINWKHQLWINSGDDTMTAMPKVNNFGRDLHAGCKLVNIEQHKFRPRI